MSQNNTPKVSLKSTYQFVRDYVVHEDSLINFRLNWLLVIQGLLFTAYGLSIKKDLSIDNENIDKFQQVISLLGIATCIFIFLSIFTAVIAIKNLEAFWRLQKPKDVTNKDYEKLPFITGGADPESNTSNSKDSKLLLQKLHKGIPIK